MTLDTLRLHPASFARHLGKCVIIAVLLLGLAGPGLSVPAGAQNQNQKPAKPEAGKDAGDANQPAPEPPLPPYEAKLLRLSEIMGALAYLQELCEVQQSTQWRNTMQGLLDAEAKSARQRSRLAGAFNSGFRGYEWSYRRCTANARLVITRFLTEGEIIARDVANRYGGG